MPLSQLKILLKALQAEAEATIDPDVNHLISLSLLKGFIESLETTDKAYNENTISYFEFLDYVTIQKEGFNERHLLNDVKYLKNASIITAWKERSLVTHVVINLDIGPLTIAPVCFLREPISIVTPLSLTLAKSEFKELPVATQLMPFHQFFARPSAEPPSLKELALEKVTERIIKGHLSFFKTTTWPEELKSPLEDKINQAHQALQMKNIIIHNQRIAEQLAPAYNNFINK